MLTTHSRVLKQTLKSQVKFCFYSSFPRPFDPSAHPNGAVQLVLRYVVDPALREDPQSLWLSADHRRKLSFSYHESRARSVDLWILTSHGIP
jgi:hypothetical protein